MPNVYIFKVSFKHSKRIWRRIEIREDQTLGHFDNIIRKAFDHLSYDHLSEFFSGKAWKSKGYGEIEPGGKGIGGKLKIYKLELSVGDQIEYVYDFGDDIQHIIKLEKIVESEQNISYPRITAQNKPKYRYCDECNEEGKEVIARWICIECDTFLCDDCVENHEEHMYDELRIL